MVLIALACAIVGQAGSTFDVEIDDGQKINKLKEAIKDQSDGLITDPWPKLQPFLAKKADGGYLDWAGAAAVTIDGDGHPQGFEQMDPTLWINNDKHFGKNFRPAEGEVHVLVVVPKGGRSGNNDGRNYQEFNASIEFSNAKNEGGVPSTFRTY
ncbi:hypothetical protein PC110_g22263 [Phytophthora cactorum]|uniref:Crinkler effector protein N-terminal domain-containing protein n=1 Tax=Phytophthora cactorum TaxID=29920 RepID=A0A329R9I9_9STRA|nr:hypothetical protein PC110_g22263 [Phytophthora cactorum]